MKYLICLSIILVCQITIGLTQAHVILSIVPDKITVEETIWVNCTGMTHQNDSATVIEGFELRKNNDTFYHYDSVHKRADKNGVHGINVTQIEIHPVEDDKFESHIAVQIINATESAVGEYVCYFSWHNSTQSSITAHDTKTLTHASGKDTGGASSQHVFNFACIILIMLQFLI